MGKITIHLNRNRQNCKEKKYQVWAKDMVQQEILHTEVVMLDLNSKEISHMLTKRCVFTCYRVHSSAIHYT